MKDFLNQIGYEYCGKWKKLDLHMGSIGNELWIKYFPENLNLNKKNGPLVYIWIYDNKIIYAGESTKSVKQRMGGHEGGFRGNSNSGRAKQKYLLENKIEEIEVFVCFFAGFLKFLEQKKNQLYLPKHINDSMLISSDMFRTKNLEENLIIAYFNPVLNTKLGGEE